ncbi:ABC transporter permease [Phenylobacterium ferrooxidans]|uniref:ABC transporter permease n=1 Tax=Phenylobacterium ferrooxidans TaxID=2982689 RepID=A0ABW6CMZ1_9CAUL
MLWSALKLALGAIRRNLVRSILTVLGVVIGVAAVITMVTLGNGATLAVTNQISSLGSNLLMVRPGQRMGPEAGRAPRFRDADVAAIEAGVSGIGAISGVESAGAVIVYRAQNWSTSVTGAEPAYFTARNLVLARGRVFNDAEARAGRPVCVIGETVRKELFATADPVGSRIRVKGFACDVVGLLKTSGQVSMGSDPDDVVIMPLRAVQRRLTGDQDIGSLVISVKASDDTDRVKSQVTDILRERRKVASNEDDNFSIMDTRQIAQAMSGTTRVLTLLLGAVAAVSLLVGGIGIMNIMLVSVTERTREIGIRLAIGALERDVLLQFLIEAVVLSAFGGLVGVVLAAAASAGLAGWMKVPYVFDPAVNLLAFTVAALIGVVFGYFPARRAARLDPIEALRHE